MPLPANTPILLLPLRIETRFIGKDLWIRVFPDDAHFNNWCKSLTPVEAEAGLRFRQSSQSIEEWKLLVDQFGAYRAAWIAKEANPLIVEDKSGFVGHYHLLPQRFYFYIYDKGELIKTERGVARVPDQLHLWEEDGPSWLEDFDRAVDLGLGVKVNRVRGDGPFSVVVTGIRESDTVEQDMIEWIQSHQYSHGFEFLLHDTPTNNVKGLRSAHSSQAIRNVEESYEWLNRQRDAYEPADILEGIPLQSQEPPPLGNLFATYLGVPADVVKPIKNASQQESPLHLWLKFLMGYVFVDSTLRALLGNVYSEKDSNWILFDILPHTFPRGMLPSIKLWEQPYGVLPTKLGLENENPLNVILEEFRALIGRRDEEEELIVRIKPGQSLTTEEWATLLTAHHRSITMELRLFAKERMLHAYDGQLFTGKRNFSIADKRDVLHELDNIHEDYDIIQLRQSQMVFPCLIPADPALIGDSILRDLIYALFPGLGGEPEEKLYHTNLEKLISLSENDTDDFMYASLLNSKSIHEFNDEEESALQERTTMEDIILEELRARVSMKLQDNYELRFRPPRDFLLSYHLVNENVTNLPTIEFEYFVDDGQSVAAGQVLMEFTWIGAETPYQIRAKDNGMVFYYAGIQLPDGYEFQIGEPLLRIEPDHFVQDKRAAFQTMIDKVYQITHPTEEVDEATQAKVKKAFAEAVQENLDLCSHRLDAWLSAFANRRLHKMRTDHHQGQPWTAPGTLIGAYGYVEKLVPRDRRVSSSQMMAEDESYGGYIHGPGETQAKVAAILKNAYLLHSNGQETGNPYTLNLTSERIQQSQHLIKGIASGLPLAALLGYRLEHLLHEAGRDSVIYELRRDFPFDVDRNDTSLNGTDTLHVIDGNKVSKALQEDKLNGYDKEVRKLIGKLSAIQDGVTDVLNFEAAYQTVQANVDGASTTLRAMAGKIAPLQSEGLRTKSRGANIEHTFIMFAPGPDNYLGITTDLRRFVEPSLWRWLQLHIGNIDRLSCTVEVRLRKHPKEPPLIFNIPADEGSQADFSAVLKLSHLDLLYLSGNELADGNSELESRLWHYCLTTYPELAGKEWIYCFKEPTNSSKKSLFEVLEVYKKAYALISNASVLRSEHMTGYQEATTYHWNALEGIRKRFVFRERDGEGFNAQQLTAVQGANLLAHLRNWYRYPNNKRVVELLSRCKLEAAKRFFPGGIEDVNGSALQDAVGAMIVQVEGLLAEYEQYFADRTQYYDAFEKLKKAARCIFGDNFVLLAPSVASEGFQQSMANDNQVRLIGHEEDQGAWGQTLVNDWVAGLAKVEAEADRFIDWQLYRRVWQEAHSVPMKWRYRLAQLPSIDRYPWVGLNTEQIQWVKKKYYPDDFEFYPQYPGSEYPTTSNSVVSFAHATGFNLVDSEGRSLPKYGLLINKFREQVPNREKMTGLSFQYNTPNAEAPNTLLLCVPEQGQDEWNEEILHNHVLHAMDLAKIRLVDTEVLEKAKDSLGFAIPMTFLPLFNDND